MTQTRSPQEHRDLAVQFDRMSVTAAAAGQGGMALLYSNTAKYHAEAAAAIERRRAAKEVAR